METLRTSPDTLEEIVAREPILSKALAFATEAHRGQKRAEGSDYITHPVAVTRIMYEEWGITDPKMLAVGFLHDVPEDTKVTLDEIGREFGEKIKFWVDGVTKLDSPKETSRKILNKNLLDPAVGIFKLADDIHNMRTIEYMRPDKRLAKVKRVLDVHAPLAESLGMWIVKTELENLGFPYIDPENYERFSEQVNIDPRVHDPFRSHMKSRLESILNKESINGKVEIRENSLIRIKDKKHPFSDINDVISFRVIICGSDKEGAANEVYRATRILQEEFKDQEDSSRFDNFYITPKFNQYSAIQITLNTPIGAVEIAITSKEKEDYNNWGILSLLKNGEKSLAKYALKLVITPTGQAKFLPPEATGLDYAYLINKKRAAQAVDMEINGVRCSIATVIPNGSDVKINYGPFRIAPDKSAVTLSLPSTQKKAEKQFLEQKMHEEEVAGKEKVTKIISERGILELLDLLEIEEHAEKLGNLLNYSGSKGSTSLLYRQVETRAITEKDLQDLLDTWKITKKDLGLTSILLTGTDDTDLLSGVSTEIARLKGNIRWVEAGSHDGKNFSMRFVVEKLDSAAEDSLKEIFKGISRVKEVTIV